MPSPKKGKVTSTKVREEGNVLYKQLNMHIEQPQTIYTFLRLCIYLREKRQIPAHWISSFIDSIILTGGQLTTSVSFPVSVPIKLQEAIEPYAPSTVPGKPAPASRQLDLRPFLPETRSVLATFHKANMLPTPLSTTTLLPYPSKLKKFSLHAEISATNLNYYNQNLIVLIFNPAAISTRNLERPGYLRDQFTSGRHKDSALNIGKNAALFSVFKWSYLWTEWERPDHEMMWPPGWRMPLRMGIAEWVAEEKEEIKWKSEKCIVALVCTDKWTLASETYGFDEVVVT